MPTRLEAVAAEWGLLLHAHADVEAVQELLASRPDISVLWAHAGMTASPAVVARLLEAQPNLWVELALRTDVAPGGQLDPDWASVFERYPDRFMIGTDTWVVSRWTRLPALMAEVRSWLRQLPVDLPAAIAAGNAARLLGTTEC